MVIDLYNVEEDKRITAIGEMVMAGNTVGYVVEDMPKAERYIEKIKKLACFR